MSYENAALGFYVYRELLLTQFLEQLPKVHTSSSSSDPLVLQIPAKSSLERGNSSELGVRAVCATCGHLTDTTPTSL